MAVQHLLEKSTGYIRRLARLMLFWADKGINQACCLGLVACLCACGGSSPAGPTPAILDPTITTPTTPVLTVADSTTISLSWSPVDRASHYEVFRHTADDSSLAVKVNDNTVTDTSYSDSGLEPATRYHYWLKACADQTCSAFGPGASAITEAVTAPTTVADPLASVNSDGQITLSWLAVAGASSYTVHRNTVNSRTGATTIAEAISTISYTDATVAATTLYYYFVDACNNVGCAQPAQALAVSTLSIPPSELTATAMGNGTIELEWTEVDAAIHYDVFRGSTDDSLLAEGLAAGKNISETSFVDDDLNLEPTTTYYYWVRACSAAVCSVFSPGASVSLESVSANPWPTMAATMPPGTNKEYILRKGEYTPKFSISFSPTGTNLIGFEQRCDPQNGSAGCCVLITTTDDEFGIGDVFDLVNTGQNISFFETVANPRYSFVGSLYSYAGSDNVFGQIFAESTCRLSRPFSVSLAPAETITQVALMGQVVTHADVEVQQIGGKNLLLDISRRASADRGGRMDDEAHIAVIEGHNFRTTIDTQGISVPLGHGLINAPSSDAEPLHIVGRGAIDAFAYTQTTYDYFLDEHSINSPANNGSIMRANTEFFFPQRDIVCPERTIPRGSSFNALFFNSQIFFTPIVNENYLTSLSASPDVVAHEWGHAYSDSMVNLRYSRYSGALEEAFADWAGVIVSRQTGAKDWLLGNEIVRRDGQPGHFRDLSQARREGDAKWKAVDTENCPSANTCNDACGVHSNNGVPNYMFYLLSEGGRIERGEGVDAIVIDGIGIDMAFQIAVAANQNFWTATTNFIAARAGMEMAAAMLYPQRTGIVRSIGLAWAAVGVGDIPQAPEPQALDGFTAN